MTELEIERVDQLPVILHWLRQMRIAELIDRFWQPHGNWIGLTYGQLAVVFLAFVLYTRTHRLSAAEDWQHQHQHTLTLATGWEFTPHEMSDDRLGRLLGTLGADEARSADYQEAQGQTLIRAYALPTAVVRHDTTTFNVHHAPDKHPAGGVLAFGYSKDRRPDLLQFKAGLSTLDPAGMPLVTQVVNGAAADDPLYLPAWRRACRTLGTAAFLWVTDCKGAALETRATIAAEGGAYLLPAPMTGDMPAQLAAWLAEAPDSLELLYREGPDSPSLGHGFEVARQCQGVTDTGVPHTWTERCLVVCSVALAQRQQATLLRQLTAMETRLTQLRPQAGEDAAAFGARAAQLLAQSPVADLLTVTVQVTSTTTTRYARRGRPGPDTPKVTVTTPHLHLQVTRNAAALAQRQQQCGWRVYLTNQPAAQLSLAQATHYYRDQWLNERSYHRFKHGSLPVLPLFLQLTARIRGLVLLLTIALQALTLLEYVAHQNLAQADAQLAGLVPGNPKMRTARPSAERLLAVFHEIHLVYTGPADAPHYQLGAPLTALQRETLHWLGLPPDLYDFPTRRAAWEAPPHSTSEC